MSKSRIQTNQVGAASLITVILLAIILSTITTGLLRLSVQDARQATDDDLTNRAFYAAESGLNEAQRFLALELADLRDGNGVDDYDLNGDDCAPPLGEETILADGAFDTEYTCQLIDTTPTVIRNTIPENQIVQIPLTHTGGATPTGIIIRWHQLSTDSPVADLRTNKELPPKADWGAAPAMLRTTLFSTPKTGTFTQANLQDALRVGFLNPSSTADPTRTQNSMDGQVVDGQCVTSDPTGARNGYSCEARINITDLASRDYELRISTIYRASEVEISFTGGEEFVEVQALVDVTGRAADVFRRIQASVDLNADLSTRLVPDAAIRSITDVCKIVSVDTDVTYTPCN